MDRSYIQFRIFFFSVYHLHTNWYICHSINWYTFFCLFLFFVLFFSFAFAVDGDFCCCCPTNCKFRHRKFDSIQLKPELLFKPAKPNWKMEAQKQTTSSCNNDIVTYTDNNGILLHLESLDKMMKIPVVDAAWHQSQDIYGKVKGKQSAIVHLLIWVFLVFDDIIHVQR